MKRILSVLLAIVLIVGVGYFLHVRQAHAQNTPSQLTMGTTVNANVYGGQTYFYLGLVGGNVTTFNIVSQNAAGTVVTPYNPGVVTIVFQQDATGSRTVGWGTMIATAVIPTVLVTANKYTVIQFYYDTQSQLWYSLSAATVIHN